MVTVKKRGLLTQKLLERFKKVGCQDGVSDPVIIAKFFNPSGVGTWYVSEYLPEDNVLFCYVTGLGYDEWGYASLEELESLNCPPFNLPIERDLHFKEKKFSEIAEIKKV